MCFHIGYKLECDGTCQTVYPGRGFGTPQERAAAAVNFVSFKTGACASGGLNAQTVDTQRTGNAILNNPLPGQYDVEIGPPQNEDELELRLEFTSSTMNRGSGAFVCQATISDDDAACCLPDGTCQDASPGECSTQGGQFLETTDCMGDADGDGTDDACAGITPVPTVSEWGLVVMTLLLLTGVAIKFGRRRSEALSA